MTALDLRLLGEFEARDGAGHAFAVTARKNQALLAMLALAPSGSLPRQFIAGLLWSDRGEAQARGSLRQALVGLRKDLVAIDPPLLTVSDVKIRLDLGRLEVDALAFQRLAASEDVAALRRAAALYRGELLADIYIKDPAFENWISSQRRRLADIASHVLEKLCGLEAGGARIEVAKRLVALDPFREASHRNLMHAYSDAGEKDLALRQYEICGDMLRDELGVAPGEETKALRQGILQSSTEQGNAGAGGKRAETDPWAGPIVDAKPSVAVLPFDAMGSVSELENFCDGLTEDIITGLARISAISVIARNTMFTYKGRAVDIRSVGGDLGARYVLEGSVRASGKVTRVSAQLIDAQSGHHVWAAQMDRAHAEIFDLQDDITQSIVASVQTQIILNEGRLSVASNETERVSRLLARSWQRFLGLTEESLADCRALAERALELDSKSGMAHRMLAIALYHQVYMGFVPWTEHAIDQLYAHASISIESEGADEYCHWAMECAHLLRMRHELAAASLRRALEINPNCSLAYGSLGTVLAWGGQYDASIESNELALRVNPQDPSNFFRHFGLALAHYLASRYENAVIHASAVAQARPAWWLGQIIYAASLGQVGRRDEACRVLDELNQVRPGVNTITLSVLPFAHAHDRAHLIAGLRKAGIADRMSGPPVTSRLAAGSQPKTRLRSARPLHH